MDQFKSKNPIVNIKIAITICLKFLILKSETYEKNNITKTMHSITQPITLRATYIDKIREHKQLPAGSDFG